MKSMMGLILSGFTLAVVMMACGKNDSGSSAAACPANYLQTTSWGCQPIVGPNGYNCASNANSVYYNGSCQSIYGTTIGNGYGGNYGSCQAGFVQTQYGCLTQTGCPVGQGLSPQYGCVTVSSTYGYGGGGGYPYQTYGGAGYPSGLPPGYGYGYGQGNANLRCQNGVCFYYYY